MQTTADPGERPIPTNREPGNRPTAPARRLDIAGLLACATLTVLAPTPARSQISDPDTACEAGRISNIFVDNRSIYEIIDSDPLRWLYRLANALHINTTEGFILREVLFSEGDCLNPLLLDESYRILESYPFIATADVYPVAQPDGSYHVVIDTQDEWSTQFDLGVSFDQGLQLDRMNLTEENLLGRGVQAEVFLRRRREQRSGRSSEGDARRLDLRGLPAQEPHLRCPEAAAGAPAPQRRAPHRPAVRGVRGGR